MKIHHSVVSRRPTMLLLASFLMLMGIAFAAQQALAQSDDRHSDQLSAADTPHEQRLVTIHDAGADRTIVTKATTVRQALHAAGLEIAEGQDVVEPALDTTLVSSRYHVNIYRARPVMLVEGARRQRLLTAEQTPARIVQAAGWVLHEGDQVEREVSHQPLLDGADTVVHIRRATPLTLHLYGKPAEIRTQAQTVGQLLAERHITLQPQDAVSVALEAPIVKGMVVELWRNGTQTLTVDEAVAFPVEKIHDANRSVSYREVKQPGEQGRRTVTYEVEMHYGKEVRRQEIASVITKQPKQQIELIGTKQESMPYTGGGHKDQWLAASNIPRDQWGYADWLVQKESSWNPNARNARSGACGLAQALPCSKVPGNPHDPVNSLNWMHGYVINRYGSWEKAVQHSKRKGWY